MSGTRVINYLLANAAGVTALVASDKVLTGVVPGAKDPLPAISVRQVSGDELLDVAMTGDRIVTHRVQVTVYAATYASKKSVLDAVRTAIGATKGSVDGIFVESILPAGEGPDLDDWGAQIFEQSRDFLVTFHRA